MTIICNNVFARFAILNFRKLTQTLTAASVARNNRLQSLVHFLAFSTDQTAERLSEGHGY